MTVFPRSALLLTAIGLVLGLIGCDGATHSPGTGSGGAATTGDGGTTGAGGTTGGAGITGGAGASGGMSGAGGSSGGSGGSGPTSTCGAGCGDGFACVCAVYPTETTVCPKTECQPCGYTGGPCCQTTPRCAAGNTCGQLPPPSVNLATGCVACGDGGCPP